jgi:hypothetical protein
VLRAHNAEIDRSQSIERIRLLASRAQMLLAMQGTHRSIRRLLTVGEDALDLTVDALPLTRVQLERCFLSLLIVDKPQRWFKRYRKNAWKAFAEKFFRDQCCVGEMEGFREYFGPSGTGVRMLREFAREMDVWEDELQTLRIQATGDDPDPRFPPRHIADMPTPGRAIEHIEDPARKKLAEVLYPFYASLSHFSHGGLVGVMQAAILRGEPGQIQPQDREQFYRANVMETTLPVSYVCMLLNTSLFALDLPEADALAAALVDAWQPYFSDGSLLGIAVWDTWAREALGGE